MENRYLFDTNTIIQMGQRYYPRDIFGELWDYIYQQIDAGSILVTDGVIDELTEKINDQTANRNAWRDDFIQFSENSDQILHENYQSEFMTLANKCSSDIEYRGNCKQQTVSRFLDKADLWLVAIAKSEGFKLVSEESEGSLKIPTVCKLEGVSCIKTVDFFRTFGLQFSIK